MQDQKNLNESEKFWGPKYGSIYPYLEDAGPYKKLLRQISEYINPMPNESWLDLGTGSGAVIDIIWNKSNGEVKDITALDLTQVMLDHIKKRLPKLDPKPAINQIKLVKHDLSKKLPFENNTFDGITASLVLTYVEQHGDYRGTKALEAVLKEAHRVLKPNGQFVWSTPKHRVNFSKVFLASWREVFHPKKLYNLYYGPAILRYALKIQKKGKKKEYNFLPEEEHKKLLHNAGFHKIETSYSFANQALILKSKKIYHDS
jgi:ubiquinone/menaquinone biosynthesis C-methylase UbiE